ncbi:general transcription factor 3C polypeptide 2 isoform X1 [Syngnathus typhle]|uniref:general transcription factor 3C polypeptide 2 isoform X1 n=1 Tax=Syngnathus typhle TaxID=161592 RepID=UPI002A6A1371|nr:general transcription factor 3C polypeptide 2 isoform X1 [Syngnathus typhle]XP_061126121.1 general transcription factor 3C polypeptide 2 isoform X1 [Syngnathus typhle]XP_061126122.1 general transcription factor 3C polypeptide 2 isoform X1 [Syngnathus typhle]XP_061126123.1 general transcription factor 3C polypeptide 2 isoform X1 [Syngnathus typhle]
MFKEKVPDVDDPEQGQELPSKPFFDLTPSSRGRQRKKNIRLRDYETCETNEESKDEEVLARKPPAKPAATTPKNTPAKRGGRPRKHTLVGAEVSASPHVANGDVSAHTNDSPSPVTEGSLENGMPKPKKKYVKKQKVDVEPVTPTETIKEEEPEVLSPGGRPRRSAAKMAIKFLHAMVNEGTNSSLDGPNEAIPKPALETTKENSPQEEKGRRGRKRKYSDGDAAEDEDFVPELAEAEASEEEDKEEVEVDEDDLSDSEYHKEKYSCTTARVLQVPALLFGAILETVKTHKKFRDMQLCSWVFPEWLPSSSVWHRVPSSQLESYLPQERLSAAFKVSRDGCGKETPLQRLNRFESLPAHPQCWDMHLFTGGPVWAMEWCPTPDCAVASQYLAVACHKDMEEQHYFHKTYSGPALVQLWDVGTLEYNTRPDSQPSLAYGLALDKGFIWHLKWCPSGGWELPTSQRKAPLLPRLGLLAVATSMSVVTIYSLPHPDALRASQKHTDSGDASQSPRIYKPHPVVTLKLGSLKAPPPESSGQVLSMDWLPVKPHDLIAIGFYNGLVGLWDLNTKSPYLRIQESHDPPSLLPYKCFLAHEHAVRALTFCPASRHFVATAGEDRLLKTWDLRRLYGPVTVHKRSLINEICWPANAPGLLWAQDSVFAANSGNGVHYLDHQMQSYFAVPRLTTIWSASYSDWFHGFLTADMIGDVILCMLPPLIDGAPQYIKKTVERRFPIYMTSMELHGEEANEEEQEVCKEERKEEDEAEEGTSGGGKAETGAHPYESYKDAQRKYYLHHADNNMKLFTKYGRLWKRMKNTEFTNKLDLDLMPLASLHKVRLSPNLSCHMWMASGGQAGLVRLHCISGMNNKGVQNLIHRACSGPLEVSPDDPQDVPQDVPSDTSQDIPQVGL